MPIYPKNKNFKPTLFDKDPFILSHFEDMSQLPLKILESQRANHFTVSLRGAGPLNRDNVFDLKRLLQKAEKMLAVFYSQLNAEISEGLGCEGPHLRDAVSQGVLEALRQDAHVRDDVRGVFDEIREAADHLARDFPNRGALTFQPVVDDRDDQGQGRRVDVVLEIRV
jgi:hypothetical protein